MNIGLSGKLAVITGASQGIGAAIAQTLAREGCDTVLVARNEEALKSLAASISKETGRRADVFAADLSRSEDVERLAGRWSKADILINNAGAIPGGRLDEVDEATWRAAWDLKVFGYINLTRRFLSTMSARESGVIVNVIGAAAQMRNPTYICGVAGNAALTAFTMSLGSDSPKHGVRVVGVSPGPVATERLLKLQTSMKAGGSALPFGRAATPEEIASAVAFLASEASGYTSGTVLMVDGGMSARAAS